MVRKSKTVLEEKVTKEAVNQVVEVGTPVTHVGDEEGVAPVADAKPRVVIEDEKFRLQLSLVKRMHCLREKLVSQLKVLRDVVHISIL